MLNSGFNTSSTFPQPESAIAQMPVLGLSGIESWREELERNLGNPTHHASVLDLMTRLLRVNQILIVRNNVAKLIAEHLHASFVAVGANSLQTTPSPLAVIAGTETPEVDIRNDIEAALGESVVTARIHYLSNVRCDIAVRQASQAGFAHQRLARLLNPASSICSVPLLTDDGRCAGALLVAWSNCGESQGNSRGHFDFLQAASTPLAELLLNLEGNTPSKLAASWKTVRDQLTRQRKICLLAVSAALIAIGFIPVRYAVLANVSIQPTVRRWVVAPFDAPLNKAYVTPGQSVKTGELLFTLDCEETLHKLASLRADAERSSSERSAHLSAGRLSDAAIAGWNAKGTNSEIEILTKHLDRAEIRSPIDGVVLGEELQRLEGSPLKTGQMLIEVAQLGQMHAEIEIPPDQIFRTALGNEVTISVDATGSLPTLTLSQLHPRAEANEAGKYVFQGRAELPGAEFDPKVEPRRRGLVSSGGRSARTISSHRNCRVRVSACVGWGAYYRTST